MDEGGVKKVHLFSESLDIIMKKGLIAVLGEVSFCSELMLSTSLHEFHANLKFRRILFHEKLIF